MTNEEYEEMHVKKKKADAIISRIGSINAEIKDCKSMIKDVNNFEKKCVFNCAISTEGGRGVGKIKIERFTMLEILQSELLKLERQLATQQKMFEYL